MNNSSVNRWQEAGLTTASSLPAICLLPLLTDDDMTGAKSIEDGI
jgi:hypothetical protein